MYTRRVTTYSLNGIALFFRDGNGLGTRRQRCIIIASFTQQVQELFGVRRDQLRKLRVSGTELLQDGLEHLGLLLNHLSKLLELSVVTQPVQVT